ncbi:hypothetical protein FRC17_009437 [Serendipita sp. 399]|nr:hypothetical protein FRC17_009437 [Serendipita sp. 399]
MLRRLEREMKAKAKETTGGGGGTKQSQAQKGSSSTTATTTAAASSSVTPTTLPHHPPHQPPPIQTSYPTQSQSIHALPPPQQPPHDTFTSDHSHPASLNSGSSGVGSTPTQLFDMPYQVTYPSSDARQSERDSVEESTPDADENIYPARVVDKETKRHSFFGTILNPTNANEGTNGIVGERSIKADVMDPNYAVRGRGGPSRPIVWDPNVQDPIAAGLLDEKEAKVLFDLVFMRLNGFVNLFDPRLHTVPYVRSRSPFLFSVLIMAGCKFWKAELYRQCQQIAHSFALKAFAEGWQSVETVQAFESLTYWKEPDDTACRMAVELGMNTYVGHPEAESEEKRRERRNRERTYLVLWVHDRSLSMQTGRNWMLPEDDLVRHSKTWHEGSSMPEDVIVAAMVNLRQIAAETTDVYRMQKGGSVDGHYSDVNHEILLRGCNSKLTHWMDYWDAELKRVARDAESKIPRPQRQTVPSSRASPDGMDEDEPRSAAVSTFSPVHPTGPHPIQHPQQPTPTTTSPPQYATFPSVAPHQAVPAVMHATPQMSPTETKPLLYRGPPPAPVPPTAAPPNGTAYPPHYGSTPVEYHPHPPATHVHPPVVVPYPAAVMQPPPPPPQAHPQVAHSSIPSELDMRYSRNLLQELGYPMESVAEWFTQAMGPSSCAGLI